MPNDAGAVLYLAGVSLKIKTSYIVHNYTGYSNGIRDELHVVVVATLWIGARSVMTGSSSLGPASSW